MPRTVSDSKDEFQECMDALREQRDQIEEDLKFSDPSEPDQWDWEIKQERENNPGGRRLCLVHDQTSQYVSNVAGQVEKSPPGLHAIPVGGTSDKRTAEMIDGRFRHIEHVSAARQHYAVALTSAARTGVGYLTCFPHKVNAKLRYMEPRIGSIADSLNVVFDPWSVSTDGSDATRAWELMPINKKTFAQMWPGMAATDFGDQQADNNDQRKSVIIAREWIKSVARQDMVCFDGGDGEERHGTQKQYDALCEMAGRQLDVVEKYEVEKPKVVWRYLSGDDELESAEYECEHIGIVPIYGYVGFKEGRMRYCGIPRRARAPQQAYNYHISELQYYMTTAPRAPHYIPLRALQSKGLKGIWDKANAEQRAYLPYDDIDQNGNPVAAPTRSQISVNLQNHEAGADRALRDLQASIGMYQANIGARSNVISGVAYDAQKEQGEASTAHFPSHLAASLGHLGNIVMQMDIRLHDTKRTSPVINFDQSAGSVVVDPEQEGPYAKTDGVISINPTTGTYSVRVVVGPAYSTQRAATNQAFNEIMRSNKELAPVIAPFWAKTLDIPDSDRFAAALAAMAPPAVKAALQPEGEGPDNSELQQKIDELQKSLQEAVQLTREAQAEAVRSEQEAEEVKANSANEAKEIEIKRFEANTKRLQVIGAAQDDMRAVAEKTVNEILAERLPEAPMQEQQPQAVEQPMQAQPEVMPQPENDMNEQQMQAILESDSEIKELLMTLIDLQKKPRKKTAHRDPKTGYISHVTDEIEMPEGETLQ